MDTMLPIIVQGHVLIKDNESGEVLVDKTNAVHPQNVARCIARAFANENNHFIHRVALGNGGTTQDAAFQINYRIPNDGQTPDPSGWQSRLYNETYSEIIDDSNPNVTTGDGASPQNDPAHVEHVSGPGVRSRELGITSQIVIEMVLNKEEPLSQSPTDNLTPQEDPEDDFVFDELGLFTPGRPPSPTSGYQFIDLSNKISTDDTGLNASDTTTYDFTIIVDNVSEGPINVTPSVDFSGGGSGTSGEILFSDLITNLNSKLTLATASITVPDVTPGIGGGVQTFGFLQLTSNITGDNSSVVVDITGFAASNGYKIADFNGLVVGANATGLDGVVNGGGDVEATFTIDSGVPITVSITQASASTFTDLINELNTALIGVATVIIDAGNLRFISDTTGGNSTVSITDVSLFSNLTDFNVLSSSVNGSYSYPANFLFSNLAGFTGIQNAINGQDAGIQNDAVNFSAERERLLTHLIFSPVRKSANRAYTIIYTLSVAVARSPGQPSL